MESKELSSDEKLQKIVDYIIDNRSDYISTRKLLDIIDLESASFIKKQELFMSGEKHKEFSERKGYKENYIS